MEEEEEEGRELGDGGLNIQAGSLLLPVRSCDTSALARTHGGAWVTEWSGLESSS